ncbi:hypothetical protein G210_5036, partial [Candida maltosa Xu316]
MTPAYASSIFLFCRTDVSAKEKVSHVLSIVHCSIQ